MLFLARKNLTEQPVRLLISVGGVGLSVMLILVMWAILEGIQSKDLALGGAFVAWGRESAEGVAEATKRHRGLAPSSS